MMRSKDKEALRAVALEWREIAASPDMQEKKRLWRAVKDLKAERPMMRTDAFLFDWYIDDRSLACEDTQLRSVEKAMRGIIKQCRELGEDTVLEEYIRVPWRIRQTDYGVPIEETHGEDSRGGHLGYVYSNPITTPDDLRLLTPRQFSVDRQGTLAFKNKLEDVFGDILPLRVGNHDREMTEFGYSYFVGNHCLAITLDLFKLLGGERMMMWMYDHPDELTRLLDFLADDRIRLYRYLEAEELLDFNTDSQFGGSVSHGYCSGLPQVGSGKDVRLADLWGWVESQETTMISPDKFNEVYLPCLARVGKLFGKVYYGCCERLDDRFQYVRAALPNLRVVSVSPWSSVPKMAEMLGKDYVMSRKPHPAYISGSTVAWDMIEKDLKETRDATAQNGVNLEFIFGDIHDVEKDTTRFVELFKTVRRIFQF